MKDSQSPWFLFVQRFRKHTMALVGMVILVSITILVAFAPFFTTHDPMQQNLLNRFQPPSATHWLGTDDLGRDLWARILYGGRISLSVGLLAMAVSITLGSLIGLLAGYFGGWVDSVLMRTTEIFLSIPRLFVLIALGMFLRSLDLSMFQAGSFIPIALVIGLLSWMGTARMVRASTLTVREREYVQACRALGGSHRRILLRHILPNIASPIIVSATLGLSGAIISESGLSYLGFGVQLPTPTWGNMLSNTQSQITTAPWAAIFPGFMIFLVVISINYIGDGLRDALDPRHHSR
ncbi:MAG TPA: ABC transporter permease [Chloroflexus aurantiacus]|jgi:peptide/nickel transport system permease protein|uniref:Binding-protein-dependent transport systems inner membrane component n=1 Tax=Chloroflexus aurantiacus (strain ATCC 29366 / DSM 635 / J-10-fl) TaxID=324602 RepID=A9WKA6_CHLAA|nr:MULTISPECIES: oligopeptide ABC transporter permease [Chloroflexus]ABY35984.1 binding-protein-dependent transport systems inner membrane component [Chloroflexus aurantiacus J-10-fl]RMG50067.1 MAG: ABC transporter permease [Chloroflexota bacterium]GIV91500.1 MAG: peptide ABC transporter permease [Chloroflexus sp.]HBW68028.1 ABC transporter permease [Chloroflexus aurantiacus]